MSIQLFGITKLKAMRVNQLQDYISELRSAKNAIELQQSQGYDVTYSLKNVKKALSDAELVLMGGSFGEMKRERTKKKQNVSKHARREARNNKHDYQ
ncbi:hypothetical protein VmeM32_00063 [Vibrio phage vB_VmeM-32]|nr:hypothetical protein VmeM32_00063 [Vibrio phage vB_VmeM-32]